jgi:hypothetical protein
MKRKRLVHLICGIVIFFAMASVALALAGLYGAGPIGRNSSWIPAIYELANRPDRFGGYFVNAQDVFCYKGEARDFNDFLSQYSRLAGTPLVLYIHVGPKNIRLPWPDQTVKFNPDWTLYASPKAWSLYRNEPDAPNFITRVDVWVDGGIHRDEITIPSNITSKSDVEMGTK